MRDCYAGAFCLSQCPAMTTSVPVASKLPDIGTSIFSVMTRLANEHGAINLSQGFPDFDCDPALVEAVDRAMRAGHNQYAPMPGVHGAARGDRREGQGLLRRQRRPGDRGGGHFRRDRRPVCDPDRAGAAGRRGAAVRAVLRLLRSGDPPERRDAGVRQPPLSGLPGGLGRGAARDHAAHAADPGQHAAQPDRRGLDRRRHGPARARSWTGPVPSSSQTRSTSTSSSTAGPTRASCAIPDLRSRAVVISSFGKTFHTTGWKVGYAVAPRAADGGSDPRAPVRHLHRAHAVAVRLRGVRSRATSRRATCRRSTSRSATIELQECLALLPP